MKNSFRTTLILPFVTLFMFLAVWIPVHAELPACIKSLSTLKQSSDDPNVYTATFLDYGKVQLSISNNRFMLLDGTQKMGTWSCGTGGKVSLVYDPSTSGGQAGGTTESTASGGQAGGTQVTSNQEDFPLMIKLKNPLKVNTIQEAIKLFMETVVKIAIPFIVVFFIWSGISFILARGNPTEITKAKNMFFYTVIGTLLILGAWAITDAIVGTINSFAS